MFASGMRESRAREIKLHDISYATFKSLLEYIYTDSVDVSADIAIELHVAADLYVAATVVCGWLTSPLPTHLLSSDCLGLGTQ